MKGSGRMNQEIKPQKTRKIGQTILIIFLLFIILGLVGYIAYDKVFSNEVEKEKKTTEKIKVTEEKEDLDAIATKLVDKLNKYYVTFYDDKESVQFSTLSDKDKILGAYEYGNDYKLTKETVDDYYNNLFNIKLTEYPELECWAGDGIYAKYNSEVDEYEVVGDHAHGGLDGHPQAGIIKYNNIEKVNNDYVVTVTKVFFPNLKDSDGYFYADYNYKTRIHELDSYGDHGLSDTEINVVKNYYDQNYEKFKDIKPQYKYTFKKEDNSYYLKSFETVK